MEAQGSKFDDVEMFPYTPNDNLLEELNNRFIYHTSTDMQANRQAEIRQSFRFLAEILQRTCPPSRELAIAMTKLDEAMFFANSSINRNEKELGAE